MSVICVHAHTNCQALVTTSVWGAFSHVSSISSNLPEPSILIVIFASRSSNLLCLAWRCTVSLSKCTCCEIKSIYDTSCTKYRFEKFLLSSPMAWPGYSCYGLLKEQYHYLNLPLLSGLFKARETIIGYGLSENIDPAKKACGDTYQQSDIWPWRQDCCPIGPWWR